MRCLIAFALFVVGAGAASAQTTYFWNNTTGNWSVGANWGGTAPTGANNTDILQFGSAGFLLGYTATNNVANPFLLNRMNLTGSSQVGGSSSGAVIAGSALQFSGTSPQIDFTSIGNFTISAPLNLASNLTIRPNSASASTVYGLFIGSLFSGNQISGSGALVVDGTGATNRVVPLLFGNSSSYSGGTQVLGGATLRIQLDAALGSGGVALNNGTLQSNVAGGSDVSNRAFSLTGANTLATDGSWRLNGAITGTGSLTTAQIVGGASTVFKFASGSNSYAGGTLVGSNTQLIALNAAGSATGSGNVAVAANATLGGTGFIDGVVTVNNDGKVNPGDRLSFSGLGNLTFDGGLDLSAGGIYEWNLGALSVNNPGSDFDVITIRNGNVALGGASELTLQFNVFGVNPNTPNAFWTQTRQWRILDVDQLGTNSGNSTFSSITNPNWATGSFSLLDPASAGGDIMLVFTPTAVPEPSSLLLLGGVAAVGSWGWRRRRRSQKSA
ncbi:MAG TPA: PEP-CTERM sorting domain-containing protein [Gemmatales bacterium]|nr:PEP-CTERM sorting domain-containing protein [Gemmatales bacterium]